MQTQGGMPERYDALSLAYSYIIIDVKSKKLISIGNSEVLSYYRFYLSKSNWFETIDELGERIVKFGLYKDE